MCLHLAARRSRNRLQRNATSLLIADAVTELGMRQTLKALWDSQSSPKNNFQFKMSPWNGCCENTHHLGRPTREPPNRCHFRDWILHLESIKTSRPFMSGKRNLICTDSRILIPMGFDFERSQSLLPFYVFELASTTRS